MNARQRVAAVLYGGTAMISLVLGSIYLLRGSFMPYHGEALGQGWAEVDPALHVLILALMDVSGAGWLALGLAALSLILGPLRRRETWSWAQLLARGHRREALVARSYRCCARAVAVR